MKQISLTRGLVSIVDDQDYDCLCQWKWYALRVGKKNGHKRYYAARTDYRSRRCILMHREILKAPDGMLIDHKDPEGSLDNRRENLRLCDHAQNAANSRKRKPSGISRYKGIERKENGSWSARIMVRGKRYNLGTFASEREAAERYNEECLRRCGDFANPSPL